MTGRKHRLLGALGLSLVVSLCAAGHPLPKLAVNIKSGGALETLNDFVRQTGWQVLFDPDAIRDFRTQGVRGQMNGAEALQVMLDKSGLIYEFVNERTITIRPRELAASSSEPAKASTPTKHSVSSPR